MAIVAGRVLFCFLFHGRKEISNNNCQGTLEHQVKLGVGTSLSARTDTAARIHLCMQLEPSCMTECPINYGFANAVPGSKVTTYITLGDFEQLLLLIRAIFQGFHTVGSEGMQLCSFDKPQTPLPPPISFLCNHWNLFSFHNFGFIHSSFLDHQSSKPLSFHHHLFMSWFLKASK